MTRLLRSSAHLAWTVFLAGCGDPTTNSSGHSTAPKQAMAMEIDLFANGLADWRVLDEFSGNAGAEMSEDGTCTILPGQPISAIRYEGAWELPVTEYEISFQARRREGQDFFAALTFPVNSLETCATFVAGGWGGALTGISCVDDMDASVNSTGMTANYVQDAWYSFRIEIAPESLKVWNGTAIIVNLPLEGHRISLRPGDLEHSAPFGLGTYQTKGEIRNLRILKLDDKPIVEKIDH
jgi:hypothetical protein